MNDADKYHLQSAWTYLRHISKLDPDAAAKLRTFIEEREHATQSDPQPDGAAASQ